MEQFQQNAFLTRQQTLESASYNMDTERSGAISLCFGHVPEQCRRKLDDRSQDMVLIGYRSTGAYKLSHQIITRWWLVDMWNWMNAKDGIGRIFQVTQCKKVKIQATSELPFIIMTKIIKTKLAHPQEVMRSTWTKIQLVRLNDHEIFLDKAIGEYGELIEEDMMAESEQ